MYEFELNFVEGKKPLKYRYLPGAYTVGIITPSRKKHLFPIHEVTGRKENHRQGTENGLADSRISPEEIAAFVIKNRLL